VLPPPQFSAENRVTEKQIDKYLGCSLRPENLNPLILKDFQKLARHLLYYWYKNKKNATTNKNNMQRL
jgi:hypothetical protein